MHLELSDELRHMLTTDSTQTPSSVHVGPDEPRSLAEYLPANAEVWDRVVRRYALRQTRLLDLLGESHHYADFCFASRLRHRGDLPFLV
jgi:hypothetical protein